MKKEKPVYSYDLKTLNSKGFSKSSSFSGKRLGFFRSFGALLVTGLVGVSVFALGRAFYVKQVMYPSELIVKESLSGRSALQSYQSALNSYDTKSMESITNSKYLTGELKLQNGNKMRADFIKKVLSTVSYEPLVQYKLNKYGSDFYVFGTENERVKELSFVNFKEKVKVHYIDYDKLEFDQKRINDLMTEMSLGQDDVDFANRLVDVFCAYIVSEENLPTRIDYREVPMRELVGGGFQVTKKEDITLDKLLFSSSEFRDALDRFSLMAHQGTEVESLAHQEWSKLDDKAKEENTEPYKWDTRKYMDYSWVGFYSLLNETDTKSSPDKYVFPTGDGSFQNPAGLNTPVLTTAFVKDKDGKEVEKAIKVTLLKVSYGSDAIRDIMKSDIRNRGIDPKSRTKYIYTEWRVENMEGDSYTMSVNSALSDSEGNVSGRTGVMYGLRDIVDFEPYNYTELQDWYSSTELTEKYLVWGRDFDKRTPLVWFKALKLSDEKVKIPSYKIQTDDISSNTNDTVVQESE